MKIPITIYRIAIAFGLVLFFSTCKKSDANKQNTSSANSFHLDETNTTNQINRTIYFGASLSNSQQLVSVSSTAAGPGSYGLTGFNMMTIDKTTGIKNMNYFISDSLANYTAQIANCADQDADGNVWVGGVASTSNHDEPYVLKLGSNGNILLAKGFIKKENIYYYKNYIVDNIKVLKNGDILLLLTGSYDMQLIRMQNNGSVIWNKQYTIAGSSVFILAQGHNSFITENEQGDIFFVSNQYYFANSGVYLTRVTSTGSLVYTVGYRNIAYCLYLQLKFLKNGELLMFGETNISSVPFVAKIKPDDGSVITADTFENNLNNNTSVILNDMEEINGQFKVALTTGAEYDIFTLGEDFNTIKSVKTLAKSSGDIATAALLYDGQTNTLFHLIDTQGPNPGSFVQFLRTNMDGLSCHGTFSKAPVVITPATFNLTVVKGTVMNVTDDSPGDQNFKFTNSLITTKSVNSCDQ